MSVVVKQRKLKVVNFARVSVGQQFSLVSEATKKNDQARYQKIVPFTISNRTLNACSELGLRFHVAEDTDVFIYE